MPRCTARNSAQFGLVYARGVTAGGQRTANVA